MKIIIMIIKKRDMVLYFQENCYKNHGTENKKARALIIQCGKI